MFRSFCSLAVVASALTLSFATPASAGIVFVGDSDNLADLIDDGGTLTVDGLLFSNFAYSTSPADLQPQASQIEVRGILNDDGYYGIEFQGNFVEDDGEEVAYDIDFDVTTLDGEPLISDVHVFGVLRALEEGESGDLPEGEITVLTDSETLIDAVFIGDEGSNPAIQEDWEFTDGPQSEVPISIDMGLRNSAISILQVTFSRTQNTPEIPAPAALPAGLAMLALAATRRRRRAA